MKSLITIALCFLALNVYSQVSFIGFDTTVCANSPSHTYTYTNYTAGGGGSGTIYGYKIFRDRLQVFEDNGTMADGKHCRDLVFVNDSTGFHVRYTGNSSNRVFKTMDYGASWTFIGGGAPTYFGIYPVNSHFVYLVTQWNFPMQLHITRCSDIQTPQIPSFVYDTTITTDIYKADTIIGNSYCGIDTLRILVENGTDTVTYHINFTYLATGLVGEYAQRRETLQIYPNPSCSYFKIVHDQQFVSGISLLSLNGELVREFTNTEVKENRYSVAEIPSGIYFARIRYQNEIGYFRLIIGNTR